MKKFAVALIACFAVFGLQAGGEGWMTDLAKAQEKAKAENKLVLIDFTGSDWCGWCIKLNKDVFSKPEFIEYADKNLVLVEIDFPRKKKQSPELKAANQKLKEKYQPKGYPTLVMLDHEGNEIWRQNGYLDGGPQVYLKKIEKVRKKE